MADKTKEDKVVLEREYIVPLRASFRHIPRHRRTPRAINDLKDFIAKHMKVADRDSRKVKLDRYLNEEMWMHGIQRPPAKIKVKCKKLESGNVIVELVDIPQFVKFKMEKDKKSRDIVERRVEESKKEKEVLSQKESKESVSEEGKKEIEKEKEASVAETGMKRSEAEHKEMRHEVKHPKLQKQQSIQRTRKAMQD